MCVCMDGVCVCVRPVICEVEVDRIQDVLVSCLHGNSSISDAGQM